MTRPTGHAAPPNYRHADATADAAGAAEAGLRAVAVPAGDTPPVPDKAGELQ